MGDHRLEPGDYTVLFILMNQNEEVVPGTYADLYLSDREIPLEGIDLYVHELESDGQPGANRHRLGRPVLRWRAVPALPHHGGPELHRDQPER